MPGPSATSATLIADKAQMFIKLLDKICVFVGRKLPSNTLLLLLRCLAESMRRHPGNSRVTQLSQAPSKRVPGRNAFRVRFRNAFRVLRLAFPTTLTVNATS